MEKEFIPTELEQNLIQLGFNRNNRVYLTIENKITFCGILWQQAFDWFREEYKLLSVIHAHKEGYSFNIHKLNKNGRESEFLFSTILRSISTSEYIETYQEARQACLEKLIEIVSE